MGEVTHPAPGPVSLRFKSLGHGNYGAETPTHRFFVNLQADRTGYHTRYEAKIKRGQQLVAQQQGFAAAGGAKAWCQHWQALNGGAVRRVSGGRR